MKNTLKPLPSFLSYTPRTDEVRHNVAELAMHARKLERELADLKAIHKTAIIDCQQYNPKRWKELCDVEEPAAIWLNGKQMTDLMKDKERLDWLIDNNCEIYEPDTALLYCDCDRESIDELMNDGQETKSEEQCAFCDKPDVFRKGLCPVCFEDHYGD